MRAEPRLCEDTHPSHARLKSFKCATRLLSALDALQLVERDFVRVPPIGAPCAGGRSYVRASSIAAVITRLGRTL